MPGRIASVTHTLSTNQPMAVAIFSRSPVATRRRAASSGWIHSGFVCEIS